MAHALTNILVHVVFSTKNRQKDLRREVRCTLRDWIAKAIENEGGIALSIGFGLEHAHILMKLPSDKALASVVQKVKGGSSYRLKREFPNLDGFAWQAGYAAFSVSHSNCEAVRKYVEGQEQHHRRMSFETEIFSLLKRNEMEFDERLWSPD